MFDLFDTTEPPPRFTFSALLALLASAAAAVWESMVLWGIASSSSGGYLVLSLLVGAVIITPAAGIAGGLCAIAMYFKQHRWAYIGLGMMGVPYAALAVYLVVTAITG